MADQLDYYFMEKGKRWSSEKERQTQRGLHQAVQDNRIDSVLSWRLSEEEVNLLEPETGDTALHIAARYGRTKMARQLIKLGGNLDSVRKGGLSPLHEAIFHGHLDVAKECIRSGASLDVTDIGLRTPLHFAICYGHPEIAHELMDRGATLDVACYGNWRPLHQALHRGYPEIATHLIEKGASLDSVTDRGLAPLHFAVKNRHYEIVHLLVEAGAKIDLRDHVCETSVNFHSSVRFHQDGKLPSDYLVGNEEELKTLLTSRLIQEETTDVTTEVSVEQDKPSIALEPQKPDDKSVCTQTDAEMKKESNSCSSSSCSSSIGSVGVYGNVHVPSDKKFANTLRKIEAGQSLGKKYRLIEGRVVGKPHIRYAENTFSGDRVVLKFYSSVELFDNCVRCHKLVSRCEHMCKLLDVIDGTDEHPACLVFEKGKQTLDKWLTKKKRNDFEKRNVLYQVLVAIRELHDFGLAHCDLKPSNIMVSEDGEWKLLDLESATLPKEPSSNIRSTATYAAPEIVKADCEFNEMLVLSTMADMWSYGIIVFEVITGERFYGGDGCFDDVVDRLFSDDLLSRLNSIDDEHARRFVTKLLRMNPDDRMTSKRAMKSSIFTFTPEQSTQITGTKSQ